MLGSLLVTQIQISAMSRANQPESERRDFALYVDEFQNFATDSFAEILSEARKFRLSLVMAHQYLDQLPKELAAAVFGNVGSIMSFCVGASDAEALSEQFAHPKLTPEDFQHLQRSEALCRVMQGGQTSPAFSASTSDPLEPVSYNRSETIKAVSRQRYGVERAEIELRLLRRG